MAIAEGFVGLEEQRKTVVSEISGQGMQNTALSDSDCDVLGLGFVENPHAKVRKAIIRCLML